LKQQILFDICLINHMVLYAI